jgi:SAM-dependent methyltransferase
MQTPKEYSFIRYLSSKKSLDDRALNRHVLEKLKAVIPVAGHHNPLRVLEVGSGIGTMIERLLDWDMLTYADYTAIDVDPGNIIESLHRLSRWAEEGDFEFSRSGARSALIKMAAGSVSITFHPMDVYDFFEKEKDTQSWDLLIAHAFMDLVHIPVIIPCFCRLLKPCGLLYLTLNFDGVTILLPALHDDLDEKIIALYHRSMDERIINGKQAGDSKTGRKLFTQLQSAGSKILAAGSSDWIVYPTEGYYPQDEAYFLHHIIHTIHEELKNHPWLDSDRFNAWIKKRHAQVERAELIYIAKQFDFLAQRTTSS